MKCPENRLAGLSKYPEFRSGECLEEDLDTIVSWRPAEVSEILKAVIE